MFHASHSTHKVGASFLLAVRLRRDRVSCWSGLEQLLSMWKTELTGSFLSPEAGMCMRQCYAACIQSDSKEKGGGRGKKKEKRKKKTGCSLLSVSSCCSLSCAVRAPFWQVLRLGSKVSAGLGWEPTLLLLTAAVFSHYTVTSALWLLKNV